MNFLNEKQENFYNSYVMPTRSEISDTQLMAETIFELHKFPAQEWVEEEVLVERMISRYDIPEDRILNIIFILSRHGIISQRLAYNTKNPSTKTSLYLFGLNHAIDESGPWSWG